MWARALATAPFLSVFNGLPKYSVTFVMVMFVAGLLFWVGLADDSDTKKPKRE
jgi:hypothetical protein